MAAAVVIGATVPMAQAMARPGGAPVPGPRVVLFGMAHVGWSDLPDAPNLRWLIGKGASANVVDRTDLRVPTTGQAYLTLGHGVRESSLSLIEPVPPVLCGSCHRSPDAFTTRYQDVGLDQKRTGRAAAQPAWSLGQQLATAHQPAAVVVGGVPWTPSDTGRVSWPRYPANLVPGLAVANQAGIVDSATVDSSDLATTSGIRHFAQTVDTAAASHQLVVVDPGNLEAAFIAEHTGVRLNADTHQQAIRQMDAALGAVADRLPANTTLLAVTVSPPDNARGLGPAVLVGPGIRRGYLYSPSTHRRGLVLLADLAPTLLELWHRPIPTELTGAALRIQADGRASVAALQRMSDHAEARAHTAGAAINRYVLVAALATLLALAALLLTARSKRRLPRFLNPSLGLLWLATAAWPLGVFVANPFTGRSLPVADVPAALGLAAVTVGLLALALVRPPLAAIRLVAGATAALLCVDTVTGGWLQMSSVLGYSPALSTRYFGFGNASFAVLAAAALVAGTLHVHLSEQRDQAWNQTAVFFALVVVVDAHPVLGADVGGALTLLPVFAACLWLLKGRRLGLRQLGLGLGVTAAFVVALAAADTVFGGADQSHLGRFTRALFNDQARAWSTITAKLAASSRLLTASAWRWPALALLVLVLGLAILLRRQAWPVPRDIRCLVGGLVGLAVIGSLVNDSGVVIAGVVAPYVAAVVGLAAIARPSPDEGPPPILPTPTAGPEPEQPHDDDGDGDSQYQPVPPRLPLPA